MYSLYINLTLLINIDLGLDKVDKFDLGTHLTRAMVSTNWSYWAYRIFVSCFADQVMLYEFAQSNQDEFGTYMDGFILYNCINPWCMRAALTQRPAKDAKRGLFQDWLLAISPFAIYGFSPLPAGVFLWNGSSRQFVFDLLPAVAQTSVTLRLLAAAYEFHVVLMWMAVSHFGTFHCITLLRVIQRELINHAAASLE